MDRASVMKMGRAGCPVAGTLEVIGERWTLLVLREAFFGLRRFEDFHRKIGCARNLLTARLATLVDHDVLQRVPYRAAGQRERFEYRLTPKGHELYPVLQALRQWGDKWLHGGRGPLDVFHRGCGGSVEVAILCEHGHGPLPAGDTDVLQVRSTRSRHPARTLESGSSFRRR